MAAYNPHVERRRTPRTEADRALNRAYSAYRVLIMRAAAGAKEIEKDGIASPMLDAAAQHVAKNRLLGRKVRGS